MSKFLPPRTTTAIRTAVIPLKGELLFDTDEDRLYIGDGVTVGGIVVGIGTGSGTFDSPTTTKGDLIVRGETEDTRLPVGAENTFLSTDPNSLTGLTWKSPVNSGDMLKTVYDTNDDGTVDSADAIAGSPTANHYYGTNSSATKGFFPLPSGSVGSGLSFAYYDTAFTPNPNTLNAVDTIASPITATLPLNPPDGTIIAFYDYQSNFAVNALTLTAPTGNNILGVDHLILNTNNSTVQLIYYNNRWSVFGTEVFVDKVSSPDTINIPYIVAGAIG